MGTNRTRKGRVRKIVPEDHWNLLFCRPLKIQWSQFYSEKRCWEKGWPTLAELFAENEALIRAEWARTGHRPDKEDLARWGIQLKAARRGQ
jgi:hypothetical protein